MIFFLIAHVLLLSREVFLVPKHVLCLIELQVKNKIHVFISSYMKVASGSSSFQSGFGLCPAGGQGAADLDRRSHPPAESHDRGSVSECGGGRKCNL